VGYKALKSIFYLRHESNVDKKPDVLSCMTSYFDLYMFLLRVHILLSTHT